MEENTLLEVKDLRVVYKTDEATVHAVNGISFSICACIVTSSAVVGSSAISSCGWQASAMAMTMRCFMPPENWWGYSFLRSGGMPTSLNSSSTRASSSSFDLLSRLCISRDSST